VDCGFDQETREKRPLEDAGIGGRTIITCILKKQDREHGLD